MCVGQSCPQAILVLKHQTSAWLTPSCFSMLRARFAMFCPRGCGAEDDRRDEGACILTGCVLAWRVSSLWCFKDKTIRLKTKFQKKSPVINIKLLSSSTPMSTLQRTPSLPSPSPTPKKRQPDTPRLRECTPTQQTCSSTYTNTATTSNHTANKYTPSSSTHPPVNKHPHSNHS